MSFPTLSFAAVMPVDVPIEKPVDLANSKESQGKIKIALVTSFPPSRGDLNEYGYHLACALQQHARVNLTILADEIPNQSELPGFSIRRCWRFNSVFNTVRLLRTIRKLKPDVVWFNIGFSTFARTPVAAFLSTAIPALVQFLGFYTHITLHTVFECINLGDAGIRWPTLYRTAGHIATRMMLMAKDVTVLLPSFRTKLLGKYKADNQRVHFCPHGTFSTSYDTDGSPNQRLENVILTYGYWGTYKRLELLLEAMQEVSRRFPKALLFVAGGNHPNAPGYLESLQEETQSNQSKVRFLGYLTETDLKDLLRTATVLVLPYSSAAGTSGVIHQGCETGLPMVAADIPEIRESADAEGIAIDFYPPGDRSALVEQLIRLLASETLRQQISEHNLAVAKNMQLSQVVNQYLKLFQTRVHQRAHLSDETFRA